MGVFLVYSYDSFFLRHDFSETELKLYRQQGKELMTK